MLTHEENELLTAIGSGTAMGELVRRYWIPAFLSSKAPEANGDPVRIKLVGESFILWRDKDGRLGFFDEHCMHRGASLALARCEGDGLRCLYHGWKYAVDGTILETPNYKKPNVRERLKAPVYPVRDAGGLIWVYLGPSEQEPPFPHYKFMDASADTLAICHAIVDANFVQVMEGTIDPSHPHILHQDPDKLGPRYFKGSPADAGGGQFDSELSDTYASSVEAVSFVSDDTAPELEVEDTLFGCESVAIHDAVADGRPAKYARVHDWVLPFLSIPDPDSFVFSVPIDDMRTRFILVLSVDEAPEKFVMWQGGPASSYDDDGRYRYTEKERWGQDRSAMDASFTGVEGVVPEDFAVCLSMCAIFDRTKENLVPADHLIVRVRRRLLEVARDLQKGIEPYHLSSEDAGGLGTSMRLLADPSQWREIMVPNSEQFRLVRS